MGAILLYSLFFVNLMPPPYKEIKMENKIIVLHPLVLDTPLAIATRKILDEAKDKEACMLGALATLEKEVKLEVVK